ncbi:unnamed protein product [Effrenium voratum]|uniref:Uncharacterized protein n=1 Tax=Effrenium voratum TaxID=2562239 RepID=A0AA36N6H1_9DINO|nr:unnamed protein product [Effrenium voratum]
MQVVEHVRKDQFLSIHHGVWVCTFALCQLGEALGASPDLSPFVPGLLRAELVVLVLDRASGSLARTCAFELQLSEKAKRLDLFATAPPSAATPEPRGPAPNSEPAWPVWRS